MSSAASRSFVAILRGSGLAHPPLDADGVDPADAPGARVGRRGSWCPRSRTPPTRSPRSSVAGRSRRAVPASRVLRRLRVVVVRADHGPAVRVARLVLDAPVAGALARDPLPPMQAREIDAFARYAERRVAIAPAEAIAAARNVCFAGGGVPGRRRPGHARRSRPRRARSARPEASCSTGRSCVARRRWSSARGTGYTGQAQDRRGRDVDRRAFNYDGRPARRAVLRRRPLRGAR